MTQTHISSVAEIVTFKLQPGITDDAFIELMRPSHGFTSYASGFVSRQLSKGEDGTWTDYVVWGSPKAAQDAAAGFMEQDFAPAIIAAIDKETFEMKHQSILWQPS